MKHVRLKYIFLLMFTFLFANLFYISSSEVKAEEVSEDLDLSNAYIGEITNRYWALVNYGEDYVGSETLTIFLSPDAINDARIKFIQIDEVNNSNGRIETTVYQRGVDSNFATRFPYTFVNRGYGDRALTIFLLTELGNDATAIVDRINVDRLKRVRTISDLTSADFDVYPEVDQNQKTNTPYKVYLEIKENPEEYVLKEVKYTYLHTAVANGVSSQSLVTASAIKEENSNRFYFTVSENSTYYLEVEDYFGYVKPDNGDELFIEIINFEGPVLNIIAEYDASLTRNPVNVNVAVYNNLGVLYQHNEIDIFEYTDLEGNVHNLKNIGSFVAYENGVYSVYAKVDELEATVEINITNIDRVAPTVIVADTITINTNDVETAPYVFDPYAQVIATDNATQGDMLVIEATYYYVSEADNTCKIAMGNLLEHNEFRYLYGFNDLCVVYRVIDQAGNSKEAISKIVTVDNTIPTIRNTASEIVLEIGDEAPSNEELISRFGLQLNDNSLLFDDPNNPDPNRAMAIEADFSGVDFENLNRYPVYIRAIDASGNESEVLTLTVVVTQKILIVDAEPNQYIVYGEEMIDIKYTCNGEDCKDEILPSDWDKLTGEMYIASGAKYSGTYRISSNLEINSKKYRIVLVLDENDVFTIKQRTFKIVAHSHEIDYKDPEPPLTWYMDTSVCNPDLSTKYTSFDEINYSCTFLDGDDFGGGSYVYSEENGVVTYAGGIVREDAKNINVKYDVAGNVIYYKVLKTSEDGSKGLKVLESSDGGRQNYYLDFYGLYEGVEYPGYARFYIYPKYVEITFRDVNKIYGESDPNVEYRNNTVDGDGNPIIYEGAIREDGRTNFQYEFTCFAYKEPIKSMNASECQEEIQMYITREEGENVGRYQIIGQYTNLNYDVRFNEDLVIDANGNAIDRVVNSAYLEILKRDISVKVDGEDGSGKYNIFYEDPLPNVTISITSDPNIPYIGLAKGAYFNINDKISVISFSDKVHNGDHPVKYLDAAGNEISKEIGGYDEYVAGIGLYTITRDTFTIVDKDGNDVLGNYNLAFTDGILEVFARLIYIKVIDGLSKTYGDCIAGQPYGKCDPIFADNYISLTYPDKTNYVFDGNKRYVLQLVNTLENSDIVDNDNYEPFDKNKLVYYLKRSNIRVGHDTVDVHDGEMVGEYEISTDRFENSTNYIIEIYKDTTYYFKINPRPLYITINPGQIEFNYNNYVPKFSYRYSNLVFGDDLIGQPTVESFGGTYRNNGFYGVFATGIVAVSASPEISNVGGIWYINGESTGIDQTVIDFLDLSVIEIIDNRYHIIDTTNNSKIETPISASEINVMWNYEINSSIGQLYVIPRNVIILPDDEISKEYGNSDPVLSFKVIHYPYNNVEAVLDLTDFSGELSREAGEKPNTDPGYEITRGSLVPAEKGYEANFNIIDFQTGHYFKILKRELTLRHAGSDPATNVVEVRYGSDAINSIVSGYNYVSGTLANSLVLNPNLYTLETLPDGTSKDLVIYDKIIGSLYTTDIHGNEVINPRDVGDYIIKGDHLRIVRVENNGVDVTQYYNFTFIEAKLSILPKKIYITPDEGQWKYYGESDLADEPGKCGITYTFHPVLAYDDVEETIKSGCLVRGSYINADGRETREDAYDNYEIQMGTLTFGGNYVLELASKVTYRILPRPITITAVVRGDKVTKFENMNAYSITYGDDYELGYEISETQGMGLANNVSIAISDEVVNNVKLSPAYHGVGSYSVIQGELYITNGRNYALTFINASFTINKRQVVIQPKPASKIYGDSDPVTFEFDFITDPVEYSGKLTRTNGNDVGVYQFLLNDQANGGINFGDNYDVSFQNPLTAIFEILPREVNVYADNKQMLYGTPTEEQPALTYTYEVYDNFTLDVAFTGELAVDHRGEVGEYEITQGNLNLISGNYNLIYHPGIFLIYYIDVSNISIKSLTDNKYQIQGEESQVRLYAEFNVGANPDYLKDVSWSVIKNGNIEVPFDRDANNIISFTPSQSLGTYVVTATYNGITATYEVYVTTNNVSEIYITLLPPGNPNQVLGKETEVTYYADIHLVDVNQDIDNVVIEWYAGSAKVCEHTIKGSSDTCSFTPGAILGNTFAKRIGTHKVYAKIHLMESNTLDLVIRDNEAPVITLVDQGIVYRIEAFQNATENSKKYSEPGFTAADDVDGDLTNRVTVKGVEDIDYYKVGTYYIVYEVRDITGNHVANNYRTVIVEDTVAPIVSMNNPELSDITLEYGDEYIEFGANATDAYDNYYNNELTIYIESNLNVNKVGTYQVIYFAFDSNGLRGEATRYVTIQDSVPPVITLIGEEMIYVEYKESFKDPGAWYDDNYDGRFKIYASMIMFTPEGSLTSEAVSSVDTSVLGRYTMTYYQEDTSGNKPIRTILRYVVVRDSTPPVITLLGSNPYILRYGDDYVDPGYTVIDNYDGDITDNTDLVEVKAVIGDTLGTYYVYYNAKDTHDNPSEEVIRTVIVLDLISPIIYFTDKCPQHITLEALDPNDKYDPACDLPGEGFIVHDDYTPDLEIIQSWVKVNGTVDHTTVGTYEITYNVSDRSGNQAVTLTRYVNVVDTTAPTIELKTNEEGLVDFYVEVFNEYVEPGWIVHDTYDDHHGYSINVEVINNVNITFLNTYTIEYTAIDTNGNESEPAYRFVTVRDSVPPVVTLRGEAEFTVERGEAYPEFGADAYDNYDKRMDSKNIVISGAPTGMYKGEYTISYCISDSSGNEGCAYRKVTVIDTIAPVILGVEDGEYYRAPLYFYYEKRTGTDEELTGRLNGELVTSGWYVPREGIYELVVSDDMGNTTVVNFTIDITAPTLYGANDGEYINKPVTIYSDELLQSITYRANGGGYVTVDDAQEMLFDQEGEYWIYATDMAGNIMATEDIIHFIVDLTPPAYLLQGVENRGITTENVTLTTEPDVVVSVNNQYIPTSYTFTESGYYKVVIRDKAGNDVFLQFVINRKNPVNISGQTVTYISQNNAIGQFIAKSNVTYPKGSGFIYAKPLLDGTFEYISGKLFSDEEYTKLTNGEDLSFEVPGVNIDEMVVAFVVTLDELNKFTTQTVEGDEDSSVYYALAVVAFAGLIGGFFYFFVVVKRKKEEEEEEEEEIIEDDNYW